jgi:undecaprenyl-diphosphatase
LPAWLLDLFSRYGYAAVFLGVLAEGAGIPVPGETMLLAGGAMAHLGRLSLAAVIATGMAGALVGDNMGFAIGRLGGRRLLERWGPHVGFTAARVAHFDRFFHRHGPRTVFIARFVTGLRVVCAVLAGGSRLPWRRFAGYNAAGAAVWATVIGLAGFALGQSWQRLERLIGTTGLLLFAAVAAAALLFIRRARSAPTP